MGVWDDQNWPDAEEVAALRKERESLAAEHSKLCKEMSSYPTKESRQTQHYEDLKLRLVAVREKLPPIKERLKILHQQIERREFEEFEIDETDGRGLLTLSLATMREMAGALRKNNLPVDRKHYALAHAIQRYVNYNTRSPTKKFAWVKGQVSL